MKNIENALDTIEVSIKYLCPELTEQCINYTSSHLHPENVLKVLQWMYFYCKPEETCKPSAPTLEDLSVNDNHSSPSSICNYQNEINDTQSDDSCHINYPPMDPTIYCQDLLNQCLDLIDTKTEDVLASEEFERISWDILRLVLHRPHLTLKSELSLIHAVQRWAKCKCKMDQISLVQMNRREVLKNLLYSPKYLTLTSSEINDLAKKVPEHSQLLTVDELNFLSLYIKKDKSVTPPKSMIPYIQQMATKRLPPQSGNSSSTKAVVLKNTCNTRRKKFSKKELLWDIFSAVAHLID